MNAVYSFNHYFVLDLSTYELILTKGGDDNSSIFE